MVKYIKTHFKNILLALKRYGIHGLFIYFRLSLNLFLNSLFGIHKLIKIKNPLNKKYFIFLRNNSSDIYTFYEIFLQSPFKKYKYNKINIIDLGGNIGLSTLFFKTQYPESHIITVEPDKKNFNILKKNISQYNNITGINKGIWNKETYVQIINENASQCAFIVKECQKDFQDAIPTITIPQIQKEYNIGKIDIIKIDVEGTEKQLFKDYNWLKSVENIFIEVHEQIIPGITKEVLSILEKFDFNINIDMHNYFIGQKKK